MDFSRLLNSFSHPLYYFPFFIFHIVHRNILPISVFPETHKPATTYAFLIPYLFPLFSLFHIISQRINPILAVQTWYSNRNITNRNISAPYLFLLFLFYIIFTRNILSINTKASHLLPWETQFRTTTHAFQSFIFPALRFPPAALLKNKHDSFSFIPMDFDWTLMTFDPTSIHICIPSLLFPLQFAARSLLLSFLSLFFFFQLLFSSLSLSFPLLNWKRRMERGLPDFWDR